MKRSHLLDKKLEKTLWNILSCSLKFFMLEITRKISQSLFITESLPFFQNVVFSTISQVPKKCCFIFQCNCHKSLWTRLKCSVSFVTFENTRENGRKNFFVIVKTAIFRKVCFYRTLRSRRDDIIICTIIVKTPCGTVSVFSWRLSCLIKWEKRPKPFLLWRDCLIFQTLCFHNLLGP